MTWRPFEPSADEVKRVEREREDNECNRHSDCAATRAWLLRMIERYQMLYANV